MTTWNESAFGKTPQIYLAREDMYGENQSIRDSSSRAIGSLSPFLSRSNFRFLPGISFPPPNLTPIFCLNTLKSCSASSVHSRTRRLPGKCICRSVLYALSASCRDMNSKNANPFRSSNFFGSLTDFKWPWALLQGTDFLSQFTGLLRKEKGIVWYMLKEITDVFLCRFERHILNNELCSPTLGIYTVLIFGWCVFFCTTTYSTCRERSSRTKPCVLLNAFLAFSTYLNPMKPQPMLRLARLGSGFVCIGANENEGRCRKTCVKRSWVVTNERFLT